MRALPALLALLPLALCARVFNDPFDLRAVARQALDDGVPRVPPQFNINSGGPEVGRFVDDSPEWILGETNTFIDDDAVIGGAEDKNLPMYESHRFGLSGTTWGYNIPVMEPGIYGCTAHFAEIDFESFTKGKRVFNLHFATANGDVRDFENIDVADERSEFTVLTKTAEDLVITGILSIRLKAIVGDSMLSGLTCERTGDLPPGVEPDYDTDPKVPTAPVMNTDNVGPMPEGVSISGTEININCGGEATGRFSAEDYSWIRGKTSQWEGPPGVDIGGAEEKNAPAVKSHRYGEDGSDWGYTIPIDNPGIYDCSLHFSETDSQSAVVGARVFDIMIMDKVLKDVDIFRDVKAPFTAVVKTFTDLSIPSKLMMGFKAKVGNAFISAITCEKTGVLREADVSSSPDVTSPDVSESPDTDTLEEPSPAAIDPSLAPSPSSPVESPVPSPRAILPPTVESPLVEPTPVASVASSTPVIEPGTSPAATDPEFTSEATPPPPPLAVLDPELEAVEGSSFLQEYKLRAIVTDGVFTETIKDALLTVSTDSVTVPSDFAMIGLTSEDSGDGAVAVSRQEGSSESSYVVTLQSLHEVEEPTETIAEYTEFIRSGDVNDRLKERGVENVQITFVSSRVGDATASESNTSNTSLIVGVTVGCILAALIVIALVAFFVVNKKRSNEPNTAAFDAPPPAMTESEMSSVIERSETGASVEYLDDDSTFTAATSRAGDHVDQVGFVKDVFGRGTADGAHGSS